MAADAKFITFEGGEGSGKSTQLRTIASRLREAGMDVVETREPGGAPSAELIRDLLVQGSTDRWQPITEVLLHGAARTEHIANTVQPALERGAWVLSDRFVDSTRVYQGAGHGLPLDIIDTLHAATTGGLEADLTLVFDVPVEVGLARAHKRAGSNNAEDRYERMGSAFHEKVRNGFLQIAEREAARCVVIDANQSEETVADRVLHQVSAFFDLGLTP